MTVWTRSSARQAGLASRFPAAHDVVVRLIVGIGIANAEGDEPRARRIRDRRRTGPEVRRRRSRKCRLIDCRVETTKLNDGFEFLLVGQAPIREACESGGVGGVRRLQRIGPTQQRCRTGGARSTAQPFRALLPHQPGLGVSDGAVSVDVEITGWRRLEHARGVSVACLARGGGVRRHADSQQKRNEDPPPHGKYFTAHERLPIGVWTRTSDRRAGQASQFPAAPGHWIGQGNRQFRRPPEFLEAGEGQDFLARLHQQLEFLFRHGQALDRPCPPIALAVGHHHARHTAYACRRRSAPRASY